MSMDFQKAFEEYKKLNFKNTDIIAELRKENKELREEVISQQTIMKSLSRYIGHLEKNK